MITNLLFMIGAQILFMFSAIFSVFPVEIPPEIGEAIRYLLNAINYAANNFPLLDLFLAGLFLLGIYWRVYLIKIFLWAFSLLPWVGKSTTLPSMENNTDLRSPAPSGTIDLRRGRMQVGKKYRSMDGIIRK